MSKKVLALLATGAVVARRVWENTNSKKDQVTVQVMQRVKLPTEATGLSSKVVALAQGLDPEQVGYNTVTTLISMKKDVAAKLFGSTEQNFIDTDKPVDVSSLFGFKVAIQVTENTVKNPSSTKQTPKINPQTKETLMYNGLPIYRHTALVEEKDCVNTFLRANGLGTSTTPTPVFSNVTEEETIGD